MLLPTESQERRAMLQGSTAQVTLDKKLLISARDSDSEDEVLMTLDRCSQ